jgi:flagellar assembly protein FliH
MATVLKNKSFPLGSNTAQTEVFNFEDVAARARDYIDTIREQAQSMIRESQQECDLIRQKAHESGVRQGENQVERLAQQMASQIAEHRIQEAGKTVRVLCEDLQEATQAWLRQWQHETVALAIAISEKLLVRQIESDPSILLSWIEDSVRLVQGQRRITLKIHSDDAIRLSTALPDFLEGLKPAIEIQVVEDNTLGTCGILIETNDTTIDRTLSTQLKRLKEELG